MRSRAHLSTAVLLTIATFDLVTTLIWLNMGGLEGNPLFSWVYTHYGSFGLVAAKFLYLLVPISILEFARTKKPHTAEVGTWLAAILYAYLYVGHLLQMRQHMGPH